MEIVAGVSQSFDNRRILFCVDSAGIGGLAVVEKVDVSLVAAHIALIEDVHSYRIRIGICLESEWAVHWRNDGLFLAAAADGHPEKQDDGQGFDDFVCVSHNILI